MVLVVATSCIPRHFNVVGPWRVEELPLKVSSQCGVARDFSQYHGISGNVLAQQFYTTARPCFRSIVTGVGKSKTDRAASSLILAPLRLALICPGNCELLGEMVLHFESAMAARGVLTNVDLGKLVPEYFKRNEQLKHQSRKGVGLAIVGNVVQLLLGLPS